MKKVEYVIPTIKTKELCPSYLMEGSLDPDNPTDGLDDDELTPGGDDPGDFSKGNGFGSVWED